MEWTQFIIFFLGVFGLFIWNRTKSRTDMRHILSVIDGIQKEMKDFHGKLERQDAEFKGKMAMQDAEFKAHLLYHHEIEERNKK